MHKFQPAKYHALLEIKPIGADDPQTSAKLDLLMKNMKFFKQEGWIYSGPTEQLLPDLRRYVEEHIKSEISVAAGWQFKAVALYELKDNHSDG